MEKSVLRPSSRLVFLGANWDEEGVERTQEASSAIWQLLKKVTKPVRVYSDASEDGLGVVAFLQRELLSLDHLPLGTSSSMKQQRRCVFSILRGR